MPNQQKIIHRRFQKDYNEGSYEVQLNFIVENDVIEVSNIQIHGTFNTGLPNFPIFEQINNKSFLTSNHKNEEGKTIITRIIGNKYANDIVEQILKFKNEILNSN